MEGHNNDPAFIIETCLQEMRHNAGILLKQNDERWAMINELSMEVKAYKTAYASSEAAKLALEESLEASKKALETQNDQLEEQINALKGAERRVICLIDGDGTIFTPDLIAQGQDGGHTAGKMLSERIREELAPVAPHAFQLWVYVFYNKRGLTETFGRCGHWDAKLKFEDFVVGFNQAAERFMMVDVGGKKEAADAKLKVHLEDNIRLPQTFKILFGGCHDNGYVTTLRSAITNGYRDKLLLLPGYEQVAKDIEELALPTMTIPQLFMPQKMVNLPAAAKAPGPAAILVRPSKARSMSVCSNRSTRSDTAAPPVTVEAKSEPEAAPKQKTPSPPVPVPIAPAPPASAPPAPAAATPPVSSYASALLMLQDRPDTPELDCDGGSVTSDSNESLTDPRASPTPMGKKFINPDLPLSKQKPPPCTLFYLGECRRGSSCRFGHDYILEDQHYEEMRHIAKGIPCNATNRGEECGWGAECCYGHVCPAGSKCSYLKQGKCKFVGERMHRDAV